MESGKRHMPRSLARDLRALMLSLISAVIVFICAQFTKNIYFGIPLLIPVAVLAGRAQTGALWNITTVLASLLMYATLALAAGNPASPVYLLVSAVGLVTASLITGRLTARMREQQNAHREQSYREKLVSEINLHLLTAASAEDLYRLTLRHLFDVSGRASAFYVPDEEGFRAAESFPSGLILYPTELAAAKAAFESGRYTGFGTDSFTHSAFRYIPVKVREETLAVVGILCDCAAPPDPYMMQTVEMILVRAGVALEKQRLTMQNRRAEMEKELERMRSDFLRAISHDFRSPLTGIIGACSALEGSGVTLDEKAKRELIDSIGEEAAWLLRMVENLLSVTRVGPSGPDLKKSLEPVEEVIGEAIERAHKRFPRAELHAQQPDELIMIPMDPMMIVQVLMNLIENAARYSGEEGRIDIIVRDGENDVTFYVRDYGRGLSEDKLGTLFKPAAAKTGDSRHGMGLGLSICRSVIRAHGGEIEGGNSEDGGAVFSFTLPKKG